MDFIAFLTFFVAFTSSILSGMAGVGGGFIMAPYWLLIGLSPAQAAANGSFMALGMGVSSLAAFKNTGHLTKNRKMLALLIAITLLASIMGAFILPTIETETYKPVIAIATLLALPLIFLNFKKSSRSKKRFELLGLLLFTVVIILGSIVFSSIFSILLAIIFMTLFGQSTLQSTVLRRLISTIQVAVLFIILGITGNFVWLHAIAGLVGGVIGVYIGTKIALKKGEKFAKYALFIGGVVSASALFI